MKQHEFITFNTIESEINPNVYKDEKLDQPIFSIHNIESKSYMMVRWHSFAKMISYQSCDETLP